MCYLCRKVEALQDVNSKTTKPIIVTLRNLHRHREPHPGDLWIWHYEETTKVRHLLSDLHQRDPTKVLKSMLKEIDGDLAHMKDNMVGRSRQRNGEDDDLRNSVGVGESSSQRMIEEVRLEKNRLGREKKSRVMESCDRVESELGGQDLLGSLESEIHPPSVRMRVSIRAVKNWTRKNDAKVALCTLKDLENSSMVSVIGGEIRQRPAVDVDLWRTGQSLMRNGVSSSKPIHPRYSQNIHLIVRSISDLTDNITSDFHLETAVAETARTSREEQLSRGTSGSTTQQEEYERGKRMPKISITRAVQLLQSKGKRTSTRSKKSAAGRADQSRKASLLAIAYSKTRRTDAKSPATAYMSSAACKVREKNNDAEKEMYQHPSSSASSLLSSRPSPMNLGSLVQLSTSNKPNGLEPRSRSHSSNASSSVDGQNTSHDSFYEPSLPTPIGRPMSFTVKKESRGSEFRGSQRTTKMHDPAQIHDSSNAGRGRKQVLAANEISSKNLVPEANPYVKHFESRDYKSSEATRIAEVGRTERRDSAASDKPRTSNDPGMNQTSRLRSETMDKQWKTQAQQSVRSKSRIFTGSLDPEYFGADATRGNGARNVENQGSVPGHFGRAERRDGGNDIDQGILLKPDVSEAVQRSRRRRAEQGSTPSNDRYRNEERKKAWNMNKAP